MSDFYPTPVLISICIPAYKNISHLKRLLDSVSTQTLQNYEVIITDDSPDDSVKHFIESYTAIKHLHYYKNQPALGTPENWNESIRRANGTWIKLMHNDDWFASDSSLQTFYDHSLRHKDCKFFFSAFQNITEDTGHKQVVRCNAYDQAVLKASPLHLFRRVYVGNPSCTFIKRDVGLWYDNRFKFVVDFEYYIRCIRKLKRWHYIDEVLLNIGFHSDQVTKYTFMNPAVQIPENYVMLRQFGATILRNIMVYDYYWRIHRNLGVRSIEDVKKYYTEPINPFLKRLIRFQSKMPASMLKIGIASKLMMLLSYASSLFYKTATAK